MNGWIKIHRKMVNWEWYQDHNVRLVFLHLLLKANYKEKRWKGEIVNRGQLITSRKNLAKEVGLSERQVRTALFKLKTTGEVSIKTTSRFSIITVEKYAFYQDVDDEIDQRIDQQDDQQSTSNRPAIDQRATTTKEIKKEKKGKKDKEVKNKDNRYAPDDHLNDAVLEFMKMRKSMRKPMTDRAVKLMLSKLNQITIDTDEQVDIINQSIMNGWLGIFPLREKQDGLKSNNPFFDMLKKGE